jgi:hypothetical protein
VTTTNCACNGCGGEDHPSTTASQRTKRHYTEADPAVWGHTSSAYGSNPAKGCAAACFRNETDNRIKTAAAESYPNGRSSTSHKGCKVSLYDSETKRCFLYDHGMTSITNQGASKFTCWASQHECHSNANCQHHNPTPVPTRPPTLSPTQHPTTLPPTQTQWTIIAHQKIANGLFSAADRSDYAAGSSPSDNVYMALPSNHASYKNSAGLYTFRLTYRGTSTGGGTGWDEVTASNTALRTATWTQANWVTSSTPGTFNCLDSGCTAWTKAGYNSAIWRHGDRTDGCTAFEGVCKSSSGSAVLDGTHLSGCWWNCVGCVSRHEGAIPAAMGRIADEMTFEIQSV